MNLKQKLSILAATVLPIVALCAYLVLGPAKASASSCGSGQQYAPCGQPDHSTWCANGAGSCFAPGTKEPYTFCRESPGAQCHAGGPGTCNSGNCVTCTYGIC